MTLAQLFLQSEAAYACVSELGELVSDVTYLTSENGEMSLFCQKNISH